MVVFDATILLLLLNPKASPPSDPTTGKPVTRAPDRIQCLTATLDKNSTRIIIPTPALSKLLVHADAAGPVWLAELNRSNRFRIVDFDQRSAVQAAAAIRQARVAGDKRDGSSALAEDQV